MDNIKRINGKSIIMFALVLVVLVMSVGYATLAQRLTVEGTSEIEPAKWNVRITNIKVIEKSITELENAAGTSTSIEGQTETVGGETSTSIAGSTLAKFTTKLNAPGDYVVFKVEITNLGNIEAKLDAITDLATLNEQAPKALKYSLMPETTNKEKLSNGDKDYYIIKVEWDANEAIVGSDATVEEGEIIVNSPTKKVATINFDYLQA